MNITMIDESYAFDGATSMSRAIGGAEKAFAQLATALAARGHDVTAINRCEYQSSFAGVLWLPFESPRPPESDVIIAFRKPELLGEFEDTDATSILWMWGSPKNLNKPVNQKILEKHNPTMVFIGETQRRSWKSWRDFREATIVPGIAESFIGMKLAESSPAPIAIVTTHPLHGLENILTLWQNHIYPVNDKAELHIYSASFSAGKVDARTRKIYDMTEAGKNKNILVKHPGSDADMAASYANARVHLYPVIATEFYGSTLAESQACGLPAVIVGGAADPAAISERIRNGQTGHIAPDTDAFINLTLGLLAEDDAMYFSLARDTKILQATRNWQSAAIEFESLWK